MRLLKPSWVNHEDNPIFSIDIHPDGTRFATGGQGQDSAGRIVIWNMSPVLDCQPTKNGNNGVTSNADAPKILCQLDHHNACVNCVRWSHSGKYLASGGDDKAIMIWKMMGKNRPTLMAANAFGKPAYETWKPISDLRNHRGDILHLAWSPEDKYLASASVDNKVIVWDAQQFPLVIRELSGHTSLVKGVTWDPVGKYLASQSDDKTLKIWRTSDWQPEHVISDPFTECAGTTHVLRLDWSTDGHYLVSAHAMNKGGPTAQIIDRKEWKTDNDFVGHRKAVVCVRFNPKIMKKEKGDGARFCVVALGSRDRSVSVWSTGQQRPLLVVSDLFKNSVMDVSWSACGRVLMACSGDGTAAVAVFKKSELGTVLTEEENVRVFQKYYGHKLTIQSTELVQNLDAFLATKKPQPELNNTNKPEPPPDKKSPERLVPESESQDLVIRGPIDKQIETRTSDGKRRITPKFLLPTSDGFDGHTSSESNSNHFGTIDSDQVSLRDKMISNISEVKIPGGDGPSLKAEENAQVASGSNDVPVTAASSSSPTAQQTPPKLQPQADPGSSNSVTVPSTNGDKYDKPPTLELEKIITETVTKALNQEPETEKSKSLLLGVKRKLPSEEMKPPAKLPKKGKPAPTPTAFTSSSQQATTTSANSSGKDDRLKVPSQAPGSSSSSASRETSPTPMVNGHSSPNPASPSKARPAPARIIQSRLSPMKSEPQIIRRVQTKKDISYTLDADNAPSLKGAFLLRCRHDATSMNGLEWSIFTPYPICHVSGDSVRIVALTEDSSAHVLGLKGRYILPPIILQGYPSRMFHNGPYLMIVTVRATLHLWNIHTKKCVIKSESIAPLLDQCSAMDHSTRTPIEVAQVNVTPKGSPVVILTNGKAFHFNTDMQTWLHYVDPIQSGIELKPFCAWQHPLIKKLTYSELRNLTKAEPYVITEIKLKLATATELQLSDAVQSSLVALAKSLAVHGLKPELHQLCEDLLGPTHSAAAAKPSAVWNPVIAGVQKRVVLRQILASLVQDLQWQDFYTEFHDLLTEHEQRQAELQNSATSS